MTWMTIIWETSKWGRMTTRWLSSPVNHEDKQGKNLRNFRHADSETFQSFINCVRQIASPDSMLAITWNTPSKHLSASSCCHTSWQDVLAWRVKKKSHRMQRHPSMCPTPGRRCAKRPAKGVGHRACRSWWFSKRGSRFCTVLVVCAFSYNVGKLANASAKQTCSLWRICCFASFLADI